jgi:hypothetical protein
MIRKLTAVQRFSECKRTREEIIHRPVPDFVGLWNRKTLKQKPACPKLHLNYIIFDNIKMHSEIQHKRMW